MPDDTSGPDRAAWRRRLVWSLVTLLVQVAAMAGCAAYVLWSTVPPRPIDDRGTISLGVQDAGSVVVLDIEQDADRAVRVILRNGGERKIEVSFEFDIGNDGVPTTWQQGATPPPSADNPGYIGLQTISQDAVGSGICTDDLVCTFDLGPGDAQVFDFPDRSVPSWVTRKGNQYSVRGPTVVAYGRVSTVAGANPYQPVVRTRLKVPLPAAAAIVAGPPLSADRWFTFDEPGLTRAPLVLDAVGDRHDTFVGYTLSVFLGVTGAAFAAGSVRAWRAFRDRPRPAPDTVPSPDGDDLPDVDEEEEEPSP